MSTTKCLSSNNYYSERFLYCKGSGNRSCMYVRVVYIIISVVSSRAMHCSLIGSSLIPLTVSCTIKERINYVMMMIV